MMTGDEALAFLHSVCWLGSRPGLERIRTLMDALGNPQDHLTFVHVTGTNGKGSVCAMMASILQAAGYRTGCFTSPYILRFHERIRVDGQEISDMELAEIVEEIRPIALRMDDPPTEFELITAVGFVYFYRRACDIVVLEVGMGGRLDSTNIIRTPALSVITGISMDHTAYLGNTPEKIAKEKAGVIKPGVPVLFGGHDPIGAQQSVLPPVVRDHVAHILRAAADACGAPYYETSPHDLVVHSSSLDGLDLTFRNGPLWHVPLAGLYQPQNALIALSGIHCLRDHGHPISDNAIREGLAAVSWPGRFEILCRDPLVIADGGHNVEGVAATVESVRYYLGDRPVAVLTGVMADKDYEKMAVLMATIACRVYTVRPDNPRALSADDYARVFEAHHLPTTPYTQVDQAVDCAMNQSKRDGVPLLCLGSLYLYRQVHDAMSRRRSMESPLSP